MMWNKVFTAAGVFCPVSLASHGYRPDTDYKFLNHQRSTPSPVPMPEEGHAQFDETLYTITENYQPPKTTSAVDRWAKAHVKNIFYEYGTNTATMNKDLLRQIRFSATKRFIEERISDVEHETKPEYIDAFRDQLMRTKFYNGFKNAHKHELNDLFFKWQIGPDNTHNDTQSKDGFVSKIM